MSILSWDRKEYDRRRYETRRQECIDFLGGACVNCGAVDDLEFDHVDPRTKSFCISTHWNKGLDFLRPELLKCQLLCPECHLAKTIEQLSVTHGGGASGKKNCPCSDCRTIKNYYMREWKRMKRRQLAA